MINFLRRKRKQLADDNKILKYLKYAFGEIILVVLGILIALSINNWNENRKNKNLETIYVLRFLDDLEEEELYVQSYIQYNAKVSDFANKAIQYFDNPEMALENPKQCLIDIYQASQFNDARQTASTYKELNTSGQINLLRNYELRTSVISFYESDWTNSVVFNFPNKYRENLRSVMPNDIQKNIRTNCGDIYVETKKSISVELPEICHIEIDNEVAKIALNNLLNDLELKKDLNFLVGNIYAKLAFMDYIQRQLKVVKTELEEYKK